MVVEEAVMMTEKLTQNFATSQLAHEAYLPFVKGGGFFIETDMQLKLGQTLDVSVSLPGGGAPVLFTGKVVWVMPKNLNPDIIGSGLGEGVRMTFGSQAEGVVPKSLSAAPEEAGVGLQFVGSNAEEAKARVEQYLIQEGYRLLPPG